MCRHTHGWGYVARRRDGMVGYIGNVCARNHGHINAEFAEKFRLEAKRIERENRIANSVARIVAHKQTPGLTETIQADLARQRALASKISSTRLALPPKVHLALVDMVKRGNRNIRALTRHTEIEVDENGRKRERVRLEPFILGVVDAPDALDLDGIRSVGVVLMQAAVALEDSVADATLGEEILKGWQESLDAYPLARTALDTSERAYELFMQNENLKLLPWIVDHGNDRDRIAAFILERQQLPHQPSHAQAAMGRWRTAIMEREGGRPFQLA